MYVFGAGPAVTGLTAQHTSAETALGFQILLLPCSLHPGTRPPSFRGLALPPSQIPPGPLHTEPGRGAAGPSCHRSCPPPGLGPADGQGVASRALGPAARTCAPLDMGELETLTESVTHSAQSQLVSQMRPDCFPE